MALPIEAENRREHRPRVLKGAAILNGINNSTIQCTIRNQHKGGAELRISVEARVPHEFLLYVPVDGVGYRSEVAWRAGDRVGVKFTGTEPKPSWFYG
ncbi:MAG: PilZ domain-containing protein [Mesorhizobium sp.]|nr:PilZ domain-containing protein [Mesorhizobium sp.]